MTEFSILCLTAATFVWSALAYSVLARTTPRGVNWAVHPLVFFSLYVWMIFADFLILLYDVTEALPVLFSGISITMPQEVVSTILVYSSMLFVSGIAVYFGSRSVHVPKILSEHEVRIQLYSARITFLLVFSILCLFYIPLILSNFMSGNFWKIAATRTVIGAEMKHLTLLLSLLAPSALFLASFEQNRAMALAVMGFALSAYLIFGSRGNVVSLLYGCLLIIPLGRRLPFSVIVCCVLIMLVAASYYMYLTRMSFFFASYSDYLAASGGFLNSFFRSTEFSYAEGMTAHLSERIIDRAWYESGLGAIFAIVPRELITWKPLGISTALSMAADPERWSLVKSEWVIGGFTNLVYDFGLIGGAISVYVIFFCFGRAFLTVYNRARSSFFFWWPVLFALMFNFMRTDVYGFSLQLWNLVLLAILVRFIIFTKQIFGKKN